MIDLLLYPHCDLHLSLSGTPPLKPVLLTRDAPAAGAVQFVLTPIPLTDWDIDFFAPHNTKGFRFTGIPVFDRSTGVITATTPGVFLFQAHTKTNHIVGRLQVHRSIVGWWFGNDSITTPLDRTLAHTQPSIYAKFSDDADVGTDLIGDITGHGYVQLAPAAADSARIAVSPQGRVQGLVVSPTAPADTPWTLTGTLPGLGPPQDLKVRVIDYTAKYPVVQQQGGGLAGLDDKHNVLFLGEGFRAQDEAVFDEIVTRAVHEMFEKPAHEPYGILRGSFNVFKAFAPSQQRALTCGFKIEDGYEEEVNGEVLGAGFPVPFNGDLGAGGYTVEELVQRVGLPMRGEHRANLPDTWAGQDLKDFKKSMVGPALVERWKKQQSVGIPHARDTFFGLHLGARLADRSSGSGPPAEKPSATDPVNDEKVRTFVARLYEFYQNEPTRNVTLDPRRHPPELYLSASYVNPANTLLRFVKWLRLGGSTIEVGEQWQPVDGVFRPSRGLIALIAYDDLAGGTNLNVRTVTAQSVGVQTSLGYVYASAADRRHLRRATPDRIEVDHDDVVQTVAHEFGHSFNLGDEYEYFGGDGGGAAQTTEMSEDNLAARGFLHVAGEPDDHINPDAVKWFKLPRIRTASALLQDSVNVTSPVRGVKLVVGPRNLAEWELARKEFSEVRLRAFGLLPPYGQQLPLPSKPQDYLEGLIVGAVLPGEGAIIVSRAGSQPFPTFVKGSLAFVPLKDKQHRVLQVVEPKVLTFLQTSHLPMNQDRDTTKKNDKDDNPVAIPDFSPPCHAARLIGVYEGGNHYAEAYYRPTGRCKMRKSSVDFCHVCAWLIVNRVDPGSHALLDKDRYPESKKEAKKHE
ncbi:M64 family metallopeptidase [Kitasatospora sp. NPDC093806]|uniref:M64 family metallopeptidase n=1 Tax=Kitasatospora sp. NPDC093806 TaxID=3155075 RepID=UPI00341E1238